MLRGGAMALMLMTIALAGCAGTEELQDFGVVEAPELKAGYAYAYDAVGTIRVTGHASMDGEEMASIDETEDIPRGPLFAVQMLNSSFGPNGSFYLAAAQFMQPPNASTFSDFGEAAFGKAPVAIRKADLANFEVTTRQSQRCDPGCRLATTDIQVGEGTPLDPYIAFPLSAGKTWTAMADMDIEGSDAAMTVTSRVIGMGEITIMNRSVEAVDIEHTFSLPAAGEIEAAMIAQMEAAGAEDVTFKIRLDGEAHTYYSPETMSVVRETTIMEVAVDVTFTSEGQAMANRLVLNMDLARELAGVTLEEDGELDMAGIAAFLDGGRPLKQAGEAAVDGAYGITVTADQAEFNVAETESVMFTVAADAPIPSGDTIRYTVSDAAGGLIDDGLGESFTVAFADPGLYQVVVQAMSPAGIVQATDSMVIAADYEATVSLTCGNVVLSALPGSNTCTSAAIPLTSATGLQDATITINAPNPLAVGGTFRIMDGDGNAIEKSAGDGDAFTLAELGALTIDSAGWTATWHRDAALLEDASIVIALDYGPETTDDEPGEGGIMLRLLQGHLNQMIWQAPLL